MSEITKLYENAGVLKECLSPCYINKTWRKTHDCPNCDNRENYPPFTAEKQIELIKWLVHYIKQINITDAISGEFYFTAFGCIGDMKIDFEEALASLVNNLWQNFTPEEQQQVKGILE